MRYILGDRVNVSMLTSFADANGVRIIPQVDGGTSTSRNKDNEWQYLEDHTTKLLVGDEIYCVTARRTLRFVVV